MMERLKTFLSFVVIIICLPYLITFVVQGDFLSSDGQSKKGSETVKESEEDTARLISILASEMPVTFEKEALKAQAVIARTNLVYAKKHDQAEPEGISSEDMRKTLGAEEYQKRFELLKSCVEETAGEILTYKEKVIQLPYHFVSAGQTRESLKQDGKAKMPYLKSVSSVHDLKSERFLKIEFLSLKQFQNKLKAAYPEIEFEDTEDVSKIAEVTKRDSASYVLVVQLPGKAVSGDDFEHALSLNSPCFSIKNVDGQVRIVTKGYGAGYGMSQFGANEMAKEDASYQAILNYYYDGTEIDRQ